LIGTADSEKKSETALGFFPVERRLLPCVIWIGAVLLAGFLAWYFTQQYRTRLLIEAVNKTLSQNGRTRIEMISGSGNPSSLTRGLWFGISDSADRAFVFTMIRNGITAACVALVDSGGKVRAILPLSGNARQVFEELPLPVYRFYADRIERDAKNRGFNRGVR